MTHSYKYKDGRLTKYQVLLERVAIDFGDDCWEPLGYIQFGYSRITVDGVQKMCHVAAWEARHGKIEYELDHLCRNRGCWNPNHLEDVPHIVNVSRGNTGIHMWGRTHCKNGHEYTPENTLMRWRDNARCCRQCKRDWIRKKRAEQ